MRFALAASVALTFAASLAVATPPEPRTAHACTGGIGAIEWFAPRAELIVLATAIESARR